MAAALLVLNQPTGVCLLARSKVSRIVFPYASTSSLFYCYLDLRNRIDNNESRTLLAEANAAAGSGQFPNEGEAELLAGLNTIHGEIIGLQSQIDVLLTLRSFCVERYERRLERLSEIFRSKEHRPRFDAVPASPAAPPAATETAPPNQKEEGAPASAQAATTVLKFKKTTKDADVDKEKTKKADGKPTKTQDSTAKATAAGGSKGKGKGRAIKSKELVDDDDVADVDMTPIKDLNWAAEMDRHEEEMRGVADLGEIDGNADGDDTVLFSDSD